MDVRLINRDNAEKGPFDSVADAVWLLLNREPEWPRFHILRWWR